MEFIAANRACGVEPLTNHIAYNGALLDKSQVYSWERSDYSLFLVKIPSPN